MSALEIVGASALYCLGVFIASVLSIIIGARFGNGKELAGLIYVIYPPLIIMIVGGVVGLVLLGRVLA